MKIRQVAVFLENKCGRLADLTGVLKQAGVNIRAVSLADTADFGILRLIVNDPDKATQALKQHGYVVTQADVIAVEVEDEPGSLEKVLLALQEHAINVEYMYALVNKAPDKAVLIMRFDDPDRAVRILQDSGIVVVSSLALPGL